VKKISPVNVDARKGWVEIRNDQLVEDSQICGGGAYGYWGISSSGDWVKAIGGNDSIKCDRINDPKIYSEFIDSCIVYSENDDTGPADTIPNPNGSIKNAF